MQQNKHKIPVQQINNSSLKVYHIWRGWRVIEAYGFTTPYLSNELLVEDIPCHNIYAINERASVVDIPATIIPALPNLA